MTRYPDTIAHMETTARVTELSAQRLCYPPAGNKTRLHDISEISYTLRTSDYETLINLCRTVEIILLEVKAIL